MSLKIENIKFDKDEYIFGEDKEMKVSFDLISNSKGYKIKELKVIYGVKVYVLENEYISKIDKLVLRDKFVTSSYYYERFSCVVPIKFPNVEEKGKMIINGELIDSVDNSKKNIGVLDTVVAIQEKFNINNFLTNNCGLKNYIQIVADIGFNLNDCFAESFPVVKYIKHGVPIEETFPKNDIKNQGDLIKIWLGGDDYVSKPFYEFILNKFKLFQIIDYYKRNINKKISYITLIGISIVLYVLNFGYIIAFIFLASIIGGFIALKQLKTIKQSIVDIKFNDLNIIKNSLSSSSLKLSDIFKSVHINYSGVYNCKFNIYVDYYLQVFKSEGSSNNNKKEYDNIIDSFKIGSYDGNNLTENTLISSVDIFNGVIKPDTAILFNLRDRKTFLNCRIRYLFTSNDIFDLDGEFLFINPNLGN